VTPKDAPHLTEIKPAPRGLNFREEMHRNMDTMCDYYSETGIAGLVLVGWTFDGDHTSCFRIHGDSFIGMELLAPYVAEIIRNRETKELISDITHG
jgi:hypothetical protein